MSRSKKNKKNPLFERLPSLQELASMADGVPCDESPHEEFVGGWDDAEIIDDLDQQPDQILSTAESDELAAIINEMEQREREALKLYEPMPEQERFHASMAPERVIIGGNRGGKTLATCIEIARAVTGQDPYNKYSSKLRFIVVGKDLLHCSKVLYRKLFLPGAFKIIRDPDTGSWRALRPGNEWDNANAHLAIDAPPLIPQRFYDLSAMSWDNKREEILKSVKLKTGSELTFFSSLGEPPQGWDADAAVFDEEIVHPKWYTEVAARLMDRRQFNPDLGIVQNGKFFWSATPQAGTQKLYDLCKEADEKMEAGEATPRVVKFFCNLLGNIHITEESRKEFCEKMVSNEDEYRVRVLGDFAIMGMRVYPEFMPRGVHGIEAFPIPNDWTRFTFVDPGRQICAVLFVAVPPKTSEFAGRNVIYDELYIRRCSAKVFAAALKDRVGQHEVYEQTIDHRAGRQTEIGSGKTVEQQYSEALKAVKFECKKTKHGFTWASDDVKSGIEAVRRGLHVIDGKSAWVVMKDKCPNLLREAEQYCYKKMKDVVTDEPLQVNNHLMDCWRYAAMAKLRWVKPTSKKNKIGYTTLALKKKAEKARAERGSGGIRLG